MHKIYLTEPEVSIIDGADKITSILGGFPSMENGNLLSVNITDCRLPFTRYNISLLFDITGWATTGSRYVDIPYTSQRLIRLTFCGAREISMNSPSFCDTGEIKFGNTGDRYKMYQDEVPSRPILVSRPFCSFYFRAGHDFVIEFDESECKITASWETAPH